MIDKNYISFFQNLALNNNKTWFHANKQDYEKHVKIPFLHLLDLLIPEVEKLEPLIASDPKAALFRINRDIRFSKDKSPYNTLMKAGFAPGGKKSELPGYYLGISAESIHVGGGLFNISTAQLKKIRLLIASNTEEFIEIISNKSFTEVFGGLKGEQAKRLDKDFQQTQSITPHIANKQFYVMQEYRLEEYLNADKLLEIIINSFKEVNTLNNYLKRSFE